MKTLKKKKNRRNLEKYYTESREHFKDRNFLLEVMIS